MRRFTHTFPQRISAFLLCLALLVGLLPVTALAAGKHDSHSNSWTALTVNTIKEDGTLDPGQYYLSENVNYTGSNSIMITGTVTLCLSGHVLDLGGENITIDGGALTLCDCTSDTTQGYLGSDGLWHAGSSTDDTGSQRDLTGGVITGGQGYEYDSKLYTYGGGVFVRNGTFTMEGGNIAGNTSAKGDGGGVYVNNGNNFTMNGGTITGNSAMDYRGGYGGGVCSYSDFIMNDGSIADNTATHSGGGVCLWYGTFTMNGGSITGNHATHSGGLYMYDASFTMNGGSITGNHADDGGVGGDAGSLVTISGSPVIQNNTKPGGANCNVYLKGSQHITIGGKLTNAQIGVTMEPPGSFTSGWDTYMQGQNPADYFTVDDSAYGIGLDADGEAVLGSLCTIVTQPADKSVIEGKTATFTVNATGSEPLSYQWQQNMNGSGWTDITGETNATYTTEKTTMDMNGTQYRCVVSNSAGSVISDAATLTVQKSTTPIDPKYVRYIVEHYKQNADGSYTLADTEQPIDEIGKTVTATPKTYEGYTYNPNAVGTVVSETLKAISSPDDIVTLKLYYDITLYTVTVNGSYAQTTGAGSYAEGATVAIDAGTRSGYTFDGWTSADGVTFANAGSAQTTFTMPEKAVTVTANWQYDSPYIPPSKPNWTSVARKLANAQPGDTVTVKMNGETEVPGDVWETIAGRDVTVILDMGGDVSWTVDGNDVPTATHFADMDFGVDRNTTGIDVDVINAITGEVSSVQITLAHDGAFGFALTLTAPLGKENAGYWANLYHYDEDAESLSYETSGEIQEDGTASLKMTHASQYAIIVDEQTHQLPFTDVTSGTWYEGAVRYAYLHDIMEGMSATTFQPNGTLSRAMAVQIFYNLEGQPDISGENLGYPYEDVDAQAWYGDAVYWARLTGVATGYGDGTFQPTDSITRQEFAQMLYNYAKYKGFDLTAEGDLSQFPDSGSVADWAETAMAWANGNELINGHDDGTLEPGGTTTRAQAAAVLMRFDQDLAE